MAFHWHSDMDLDNERCRSFILQSFSQPSGSVNTRDSLPLTICLSLHSHICHSSACLPPCGFICYHPPIQLSVHISIEMCNSSIVHPSVHLPIHLFICLCPPITPPAVSLSVHTSDPVVRQSIWMEAGGLVTFFLTTYTSDASVRQSISSSNHSSVYPSVNSRHVFDRKITFQ